MGFELHWLDPWHTISESLSQAVQINWKTKALLCVSTNNSRKAFNNIKTLLWCKKNEQQIQELIWFYARAHFDLIISWNKCWMSVRISYYTVQKYCQHKKSIKYESMLNCQVLSYSGLNVDGWKKRSSLWHIWELKMFFIRTFQH